MSLPVVEGPMKLELEAFREVAEAITSVVFFLRDPELAAPSASSSSRTRTSSASSRPQYPRTAASVPSDLGDEVVTARNGEEALHLCAASEPFSLLISDVVMPRMSGPELARALPGVKVLFMSGYTSGAIQTVDELGGEAALLQKPFTPHDLAHRVRELLDGAEP